MGIGEKFAAGLLHERCATQIVPVALGFGTFMACYPGGSVGVACVAAFADGWECLLAAQMAYLLATAVVCLIFCRTDWGYGVFCSPVTLDLSFASFVAFIVIGCALVSSGGHIALVCLAFFALGAAGACPLLFWFDALLAVYRASGRTACMGVIVSSQLLCVLLACITMLFSGSAVALACVAIATVLVSCISARMVRRPSSDLAENVGAGRRGRYGISPYLAAVLVCFGVTWALSYAVVAVSTVGGAGIAGVLGGCAAGAACTMALLGRFGARLRFGLIIRLSIAVSGSLWVLVPVLAGVDGRLVMLAVSVVFFMQGIAMTLLSVEVAREYGLSIASVMPVNYAVFVAAGLVAVGVFGGAAAFLDYSALMTVACVLGTLACFAAMPLLPSRTSDAVAFTLDELPEDEGFDARVESARVNLAAKYGLSAREGEVLDLLLEGFTREEMAQRLCISAWTVKDHVGSIYSKVGVHSVKELMMLVAGGVPER